MDRNFQRVQFALSLLSGRDALNGAFEPANEGPDPWGWNVTGAGGVDAFGRSAQVLCWAYWWNSTESLPDDVTNEQVLIELNTDFSTKGLASQDIQAIVAALNAPVVILQNRPFNGEWL
jgi:hypothetical protein